MGKKIGIPAVGVCMLFVVSVTSATDHSARGEYETKAADDELFTESGRVLTSDLSFSRPNMETVVAPEGSRVTQSVLPIVWQFSALLPLNDYLKTAVIHSVGSDEKIRPWQDVQTTFYEGLLVDGASDMDAKIAFAGAYSFSPRWALVELIRIDEAVPVYPGTELYSVKYFLPATKRMTLDGYRKLALEILRKPEEFTLDDIKTAVDAVDSTVVSTSDGVAVAIPTDVESATDESVASKSVEVSAPRIVIELPEEAAAPTGVGVATGSGNLLSGKSNIVVKSGDDPLPADSGNVTESIPVVVPVPATTALKTQKKRRAEIATTTSEGTEDEILSSTPSGFTGSSSTVLSSSGALSPTSASELRALEGPVDDWVTLPDGSVVMRSTKPVWQ